MAHVTMFVRSGLSRGRERWGSWARNQAPWLLWVHSWESCVRCDGARQGRGNGNLGEGIRSKWGVR